MDHPQIFVDFHHSSLLQSFILLFEKRLGGSVFRPIGLTWYERGFWNVFPHEATRLQYLGMDQMWTPEDGTPPLNRIDKEMNDFYICRDTKGDTNKAITFEQFLTKKIDYVIASLPQHIKPFQRLIQEYKPEAKLIVQLGNRWGLPLFNDAKNILDSTRTPDIPPGANYQLYHQEFDTNIFRPENWIALGMDYHHPAIKTPEKKIFSFINVFQDQPEYNTFQQLEQSMREWEFKSFGGQCRDGCLNGDKELADAMRQARFIMHLKTGDGYGHILHNAAAVGRPLIVKKSYYNGAIGSDLLVDGITCIDIDGLGIQEAINKIEHFSDEERYRNMCQNIYTTFRAFVNFEKEAEEIKGFLARAI